jgi:glyoxylase-like metal-dependent hydrolase (beta-lactamase superfamily II)
MFVNSYILTKNSQTMIIDPGFNGLAILTHLSKHNLNLESIVFTHGHYDHIRDVIKLLENNKDIKVYIHEYELDFLYNPDLNLSSSFGLSFALDKKVSVIKLIDGQIIDFCGEQVKVMHLPGHSKGSIGLVYNQHFFSGDTLFFDSIGRTDLVTGDNGKIYGSLEKIKRSLSKNTIVYPGHGKGGRLSEILMINRYLV